MSHRSKRNKVVSLTKIGKKDKTHKEAIIEKVKNYADKFDDIYAFSFQNMRTQLFREIQQNEFAGSKFVIGKNKVIQVALGKNDLTEYKKNIYMLSAYMKGDCGLLFTNKPKEEILKFFQGYSIPEFATTGFIPESSIVLEKGSNVLAKFQGTMEPYFRKLGLHTSLLNAQIQLDSNFVLCEKGKPLASEQAKLLVQFQNLLQDILVTLGLQIGRIQNFYTSTLGQIWRF